MTVFIWLHISIGCRFCCHVFVTGADSSSWAGFTKIDFDYGLDVVDSHTSHW